MSYNKDFVVDEAQISSFLENTLNFVENASSAELAALDEIKKLFKKNVGMFRRDYVTALLIKNALSRASYSHERGERHSFRDHEPRSERYERRSGRDRDTREREPREARDTRDPHEMRDTSEDKPHAPRVEIAPDVAATIFVGIGRNRRVFPRDLVGLLVSVAGLEKERIGNIRVLTNYSFVQLYKDDCEKTIKALNGYDYRGRKLEVSYSKDDHNKTEENDSASDASGSLNAVSEKEESIPLSSSVVEHSVSSEKKDDKPSAPTYQTASSYSSSSSLSSATPYSETADDGQIKSHFGDGAAY